MVLVVDNNLSRNQWPLGRIVSVKSSSDGLVRSAKIRIATRKNSDVSNFDSTVIERPIVKLVKLLSHDY